MILADVELGFGVVGFYVSCFDLPAEDDTSSIVICFLWQNAMVVPESLQCIAFVVCSKRTTGRV